MSLKRNLLVFDIDGTLTDTVPIHKTAFVRALEQLGVREIDTNFNAYRHHTDYHIAKTIYEKDRQSPFDDEPQATFETLLSRHIEQAPFEEIDGARKMISTIASGTEFGICYATGSLRRPAIHKLNHIGIHFEPLQLAASNGIEERERIVDTAIKQAQTFYGQTGFDRIISVGDGLWDLLTARNLGIEFIGIGRVHQALLEQHGATLHFLDWHGFSPDLIAAPVL